MVLGTGPDTGWDITKMMGLRMYFVRSLTTSPFCGLLCWSPFLCNCPGWVKDVTGTKVTFFRMRLRIEVHDWFWKSFGSNINYILH